MNQKMLKKFLVGLLAYVILLSFSCTENVPAGAVGAGSPAKIVQEKDEKTESKTDVLGDLRG